VSPKCAARQTTQLCHLPEPKVAPLHIWQGIPVRERTTARKTAPRPQVAREPHCLVQRSAMSITSPAAEAQSAQGCQEPGSSGYGWRDTRAWVPGWCGRSGGLSHPRASLGRGWAFGALVIVTRVRPMSSLCLATFLNHLLHVPDSSVGRPTEATQERWTCWANPPPSDRVFDIAYYGPPCSLPRAHNQENSPLASITPPWPARGLGPKESHFPGRL